MMRTKVLTALQKTYDDSYLSCSTAVYYESQGDETEASRHWKHALEQIYEHRATKVPPGYGPETNTEKALVEALKQLELQCKERIDLLEALRVSRRDDSGCKHATNSPKKSTENTGTHVSQLKGSIGQGTIPAITYSELTRPTMSARPYLPPRASSITSTPTCPSESNDKAGVISATRTSPRPEPRNQLPRFEKTLCSPSPEKHTLRKTLRSSRTEKPDRPARKSPSPVAEGSSRAATLAWSSIGTRDREMKASSSTNGIVTATQPASRQTSEKLRPASSPLHWDSHSRRLVSCRQTEYTEIGSGVQTSIQNSKDDSLQTSSSLSVSAASSALISSSSRETDTIDPHSRGIDHSSSSCSATITESAPRMIRYDRPVNHAREEKSTNVVESKKKSDVLMRRQVMERRLKQHFQPQSKTASASSEDDHNYQGRRKHSPRPTIPSDFEKSLFPRDTSPRSSRLKQHKTKSSEMSGSSSRSSDEVNPEIDSVSIAWEERKISVLKNLPSGIDEAAARQILNDVVVQGDEVHWSDVAGLEIAKNALREAVVYPFLRPDLFMGLREPARGMLLFGPPGTGKTMLARAVATESKSTFFSISASSLTSKYLGESEKLVRALFGLARSLAPSIIFVDEIDALLSQRSGSGEHEATRRIKTEFLIQWSDLQRAAAGREITDRDRERGDANRVLVLAATNLPWEIDEAARRRFVRRQYIPLPEPHTRKVQLRTLLGEQKHGLSATDIENLVGMTDGFSGSDITALAKDAAMGPLRSLGEALLQMNMDDIRPILLADFEASLGLIRPSVGKDGLKEYEDWAREFGERGG
ncbi:hypothetical protein E4U60_007053 [Claviceps pazoutovae]|uniref:AAA+ ATPase domain-containing protein n=1 Tax=Claviceps pazoutovae TaxID=1649127 RepID=A0A9P7M625_9HYPO|nr:hypothetical protein E4U60_007053 [Claviceps pazoutovae]